jgi:hypothetical protein
MGEIFIVIVHGSCGLLCFVVQHIISTLAETSAENFLNLSLARAMKLAMTTSQPAGGTVSDVVGRQQYPVSEVSTRIGCSSTNSGH